jgi:hypothetical protein
MANNSRAAYILSMVLVLFTGLVVKSQDPVFMQVVKKFDDHNRKFVQEKLFVHTDKDFYLAGEIVWFKIYCLNGNTHKPMDVSKVAYAEILDAQGKSILQAKISLSKDGGSGSLYLPLSMNSGNFVFRAYTSWMRNFGEEVFFEKKITIVNTMKNSPTVTADDSPVAQAAFFPEGGHLVDGISSKTAFIITNSNGMPVNARGFLLAGGKDTILNFSPNKNGTGNFIFTPSSKTTYSANILLPDGKVVSQVLPQVNDHGYAMSVTDNMDGRLKVKVVVKAPSTFSGSPNVFLLAHSRQQVKVAQQGYIGTNQEFAWLINKNDLAEGINHLTIFNDRGMPVSERLAFKQPGKKTTATISMDTDKYEERSEIKLSIQTTTSSTLNSSFNGSLSVYQADSSNTATSNIYNYLMLESEIGAIVQSTDDLLSTGANAEETIDNLLLTRGWRRFKWDNIFSGNQVVKFLPEIDGHVISGKVINVRTGAPAPGVECYLSIPSYPFGFYLAESDSSGLVRFSVRNYFGSGEIIAQVSEPEREKYRVDLLNPYTDRPVFTKVGTELSSISADKLLEKSIAMQAQNIYQADSIKRYSLPVAIDTLPFYGKAEFSYNLDDYKRFTTMEEVFREYVMQINVRTQNSRLEMVVFDESSRQFYSDNILVLLDGIPLYDYNKIFTYDPLKINKLEVVPRRYLYGTRVFSGIASFQTTNEKFDGFTLDPSLLAVDYEGLQLQREFYSPQHNNPTANSKRIPDLRTTLFWEPYVKTDQNGKASFSLFSSDMKGKFIAVLQGVDGEGRIFHDTKEFEVR